MNKYVVALDVEEGVLGEVGGVLLVVVLVDDVGLGPEWAQARGLEGLPPAEEVGKRLVPDVDLELELTEGEGLAGLDVRAEEGGEGLKLPTFNVNLEDVNMRVA